MKECWLSGEVALYHVPVPFRICHGAAGSQALWSQLSAQLQIISLPLSANSHHAAMNIPSLPPSRSTQSLTRVCRELNDELQQLHGKSACSDGDYSLIGPASASHCKAL